MLKPLKKKYQFDDTPHMGIPRYLKKPLSNWVIDVLKTRHLLSHGLYSTAPIDSNFIDRLQINLREEFPDRLGEFLNHIFANTDRAITVLEHLLYDQADTLQAMSLESILSKGGSGYSVLEIKAKDGSSKDAVNFRMVERVPLIVQKTVEVPINSNKALADAWIACYGRNPDYHKVVRESQNVLEEVLRGKYVPNDKSPQLGKLIKNIEAAKTALDIKGGSLLDDTRILLQLIKNIPSHRGMHTSGTGKDPGKEEAEYILYTTIYLWMLHDK